MSFSFCFGLQDIAGQYFPEFASVENPIRTVSEKLGSVDLTIEYSSPSIEGEEIFGATVPYDEVWTTDTSNAATIEFTSDVVIENTAVSAGKYSVLFIPKSNGIWTIIVNEETDLQLDEYDMSKDVLRMDAETSDNFEQERATFSIDRVDMLMAHVIFSWVNDKVFFEIEADIQNFVQSELDSNLATAQNYNRWIFYLLAAEILLNSNENINQAKVWIDLSESHSSVQMEWNISNYSYHYVLGHMLWTKAKILAAQNNFEDAVDYALQTMNLANNEFYITNKESENIDELYDQWSDEVDDDDEVEN